MNLIIDLLKFPPNSDFLPRRVNPRFEFHILADIRKKYQFDEILYAISGNVIFANFQTVRSFAKKMNDRRNLVRYPDRAIHAGQLNAMGLIDEINHFMMRRYEEVENPGVVARAINYLYGKIGEEQTRSALMSFSTFFPSSEVYRGGMSTEKYLSLSTGGKPHTEIVLEEIILLWFANINPAFSKFHELFDDVRLRETTAYSVIIESLRNFFGSEKSFGPGKQTIFELLYEPILASPHSLDGQLAYIRKRWGMMLSKQFIDKMAGAGDLIKEETKQRFYGGEVSTPVPRYGRGTTAEEIDQERFTSDLEWMPNVILLAKNIYVWLDQLSKKYQRSIQRLDEIPDEELDQLTRWNITGLWLIGIWERSPASQTIKRMTGNPEAVSSAYSLYDYDIANDLGGEDAFRNFESRAWQRGIRLAGDMVPNHVGLYSKWVIEHPEYFIQSEHAPFPNYRFTGVNLSSAPGIEIRIEDGYWTKQDAAVVFQRIDRGTGSVRYLYHGNDGTNMPWNDTAQLDFLKADVREAVIQTIFHVARKFSIIRFDAAMVLAKKHFHRLWYPEPGSGGDIPSRADHAMSNEMFDQLFPVEFWREVVDRINRDMPNTLLLAEAFWMLEGYFVRTLGMHRVYNSAFMHMIMKEENANYRELIRNTLAYNPEILKRYVNFMSNPDERTAVDQFGKEDKYFGVAMMMVTMPGLPMFGHGQIEGFTEKYGMEYRKAYYDELPDQHLLARHEREIFPILKKRYLFSQVSNFELFDFHTTYGHVSENLIVYSNSVGEERVLFCYNNKYDSVSGTIGRSVLKVNSDGAEVKDKTIGEALGLNRNEKYFYILKEHRTGLHFIRSGKELCGQSIHLSLRGFEYQLFMNFREVYDTNGEYTRLADVLKGSGVSDVDRSLKELRLMPVHKAFRKLCDRKNLHTFEILLSSSDKGDSLRSSAVIENIDGDYTEFLHQAGNFLGITADVEVSMELFREDMIRTQMLVRPNASAFASLKNQHVFLFALIVLHGLTEGSTQNDKREQKNILDDLLLEDIVDEITAEKDREPSHHYSHLAGILLKYDRVAAIVLNKGNLEQFSLLLDEPGVQQFIQTNTYQGITYYSKERFGLFVIWLMFIALLQQKEKIDLKNSAWLAIVNRSTTLNSELNRIAEATGYQLHALKEQLSKQNKR